MYQSFNECIGLLIYVCIYFYIFPRICFLFISVSVSVRHIQKLLLVHLKEQLIV